MSAPMPGTRLFDLTGRAEVEVGGKDRVAFLQGLLTNDVTKVAPGSGCHAALLTPKGRMRADLRVLAFEDRLIVDAEPLLASALEPMFRSFLFYQEVTLRDLSSTRGVLHLAGSFAGSVLSAAGAGSIPERPDTHFGSRIAGVDVVLHQTSRTGATGFDIRAEREAVSGLTAAVLAAGASTGSADEFETARIAAGIPRWGADLDESVLPNEARLERDAISYTKGCYLGQETVARIRTYGHVNRLLVGVLLPAGTIVSPGAEIRRGEADEKAGAVTSVAPLPVSDGTLVLGYVKRDLESPGTALTVVTPAGAVPGTVAALPLES